MSGRSSQHELVDATDIQLNRRTFLERALMGAGTLVVAGAAAGAISRVASAQQQKPEDQGGVVDMSEVAYRPVSLPPKPGAKPLMTAKEIDAFERTISCPCPCNLDVFTCRTTDLACGNSPAVHSDVQAMVAGGHSADEIMQALLGVYGNNILMAPPKEGVNLIAWFAPFVALGVGAIFISSMMRRWRLNAQTAAAASSVANLPTRAEDIGASADELERLRAALRDDSRK